MNKRFEKLVEIAKALRPYKQNYRCFHVAFILDKKKIESIGWNDGTKTHPDILKYPYNIDSKVHAEFNAIKKMKRRECKGKTMVVIRVGMDNKLMNSKPCKGCQSFIEECKIDKVYFSTNEEKIILMNRKK